MAEFTGERVIPGQVEPDLFNEHFARYHFASRLACGKRVLDIACGTGYGSAELAAVARSVTGLDVSSDAIDHAREHYPLPNLEFLQASAEQIPLPDHSFDLIVAFEVIEHLEDYPALLEQSRRLLSPSGQFIVSTPNKLYYEDSRRDSGPNPFHVHEFEYDEFRRLLAGVFPHVSLFLQNHSDSITFQPTDATHSIEVRSTAPPPEPGSAHFFVAVCAMAPQLGSPTFVFVPTTANTLRERELHIAKLEKEVATKSEWLDRALTGHKALVEQHQQQTDELQQRNLWAGQLNRDLTASQDRVGQLQTELAQEQTAAKETVAQYEAKLRELEQDIAEKARWALETEQRLSQELDAKCRELAQCVSLLHESENTVEERTKWALQLQKEVEALESRLSAVSASRWYRVGRTLGLGPELRQPS